MEDRTIFMRTPSVSNFSRVAIAGIALWGSLLAAQPVMAATPHAPQVYQEGRVLRGDKTVTGSEFNLQSGDRLRGNLTVLGGEVTIEEGSLVEGDLTILGGSATVAGQVKGDVNVLGGQLNLDSGSRVDGELTSVGGDINRDDSAHVGQVRSTHWRDNMPAGDFWHNAPFAGWFNNDNNDTDRFGGLIGITLFAVLVAYFLPKHLGQGVTTVRSHTLHSLVVGGLSFAAVIAAAVIMSVTLIMIPAAIVVSLGAGLLVLAGWVTIARIVGARLMQGFNKSDWTLAGQVAAGSVLLSILGMLPFVGDLIGWGAALTGFGALILTRLGTQSYPKQNTSLTTMPPTAPMSI